MNLIIRNQRNLESLLFSPVKWNSYGNLMASGLPARPPRPGCPAGFPFFSVVVVVVFFIKNF